MTEVKVFIICIIIVLLTTSIGYFKYGKDLAQFDEAIANAKNEEDRTTLRDNKAILQQKYEESQGEDVWFGHQS